MKRLGEFLELNQWSAGRRWVASLIGFLVGVLLAAQATFQDTGTASSMILFIPILALLTAWIEWEASLVMGLLALVFGMLALAPFTPLSTFWFAFTLCVLALIGMIVIRDVRHGEERVIRARSGVEEAEVSVNALRAEVEKVRAGFGVDQFKIQRYRALNELARNLAMVYKTQDVVVLLIETISKTFMAPGAVYALLLFDSNHGKALHAVRYSMDTDMETRLNRSRLDAEEPYNAWVGANARALFSNDTHKDFRFENYAPESGPRSLIATPLLAGQELVGLLRIESPQPDAFRQDDARLLSNFADLGTVALEQAGLYRQTVEMAITDGLTGLYVQRYYKERVRDEYLRAKEYKLPLCVMMMDVDNFKSYNDTYGHLVGDKVLRAIAKVLKDTVRTVDLVARYGGEEFSVLLPKTAWEGSQIVAERIRKSVEQLEIPVVDQMTRVTVSIGVAEFNPAWPDADEFIRRADQALYRAKAEGKNRVCRAETGPGEGA